MSNCVRAGDGELRGAPRSRSRLRRARDVVVADGISVVVTVNTGAVSDPAQLGAVVDACTTSPCAIAPDEASSIVAESVARTDGPLCSACTWSGVGDHD